MWTRLMDLVVLVAEMSRGADRQHVEFDKELTRRGYSPDEIGHAVFWFSSRTATRDAQRRCGTRVLSEFERMSLSTEAYGYLYRLQNLGLIDARQFETIVARAIPMGGDKVGIEEVKSIAYAVIFDKEPGDLEEDVFGGFDADGEPV
jgi:uncharacterized protein Smg (DUF494 family)